MNIGWISIFACHACKPSLKKLLIKQAFGCLLMSILKSESLDMDRALNFPSLLHWALQEFLNFLAPSQNHLLLGSKHFFFFGSKFLSMYSYTFDSILSRSLRILFFILFDRSLMLSLQQLCFVWKIFQNGICTFHFYISGKTLNVNVFGML